MSKFLVESLQNLEAYTPGQQTQDTSIIKLNTNENPYPPPQSVEKIVAEKSKSLQLYCDPTCKELSEAFGEAYSISPKNVLFANGSDEILAFCFFAFCDKKTEVCFSDISYGFYEVFADLFQVPCERVPLQEDLSICISDYFHKNKTIIIANPNAPTSLCLNLTEIEEILQQNPNHIVIIDEAYVDFGGESAMNLTSQYENLVVTGTFSKSRNLAGARLGYVVANQELIEDLNKIKYSFNPYNVNSLTQAMGVASLKDTTYFKECCDKIVATRQYFQEELKKLNFKVLDSKANFVFVSHEKIAGATLLEELKHRNILVRHFQKEKIKDYVRITIGTQDNMEILIKNLTEMVDKANA